MNIQTIQQIIHQKNQNLSIVWQILEAVKIHAVHFQPSGPVHPCIHRAVSAASRTPGDRPALIFNQIASDVIVIILVNMGNQGREYGKPRQGIWETKAVNMGNQGSEYGKLIKKTLAKQRIQKNKDEPKKTQTIVLVKSHYCFL